MTTMKFILFLNIFLLLLVSPGHAQTIDHKSQLNFSLGPSFPIGQFANKNIYNDKAGIAGSGGTLTISYTYLMKKNIGFAVSLLGQVNPLNTHSMEESFAELKFASFVIGWGTGPPSAPTGVSYPDWKFKKASWKLGALLAGGYGEFKTNSSKLTFTTKAIIGLVYAVSPKVDGSSITDTSNVHVTQSSESAFGFGYSLSGGIKIKLNKKMNFTSGLEYFGTNNITFKNIVASVTGVKNPSNPATMTAWQSTVASNSKQTISSLNLLVGLSLQL